MSDENPVVVIEEPVVEEPVVIEEPVPEPVVEEPVPEPVVEEPVPEPVVEEPVPEPVVEEPVLVVEEPIPEPVVEEPVLVVEEPVPEPVVEESVPEPVVEESVPEPVVEEPVPEPVVEEPVPEPVVEEPVPEPVVEESVPVVEEPVPEPVVEEPVPVVEEPVPVVEESVPEPVVEEPVPEPVPEPVVEPVVVVEEPMLEKSIQLPESVPEKIPKLIFIVPYRDREQQQIFFKRHMTEEVLSDYAPGDYKIYYIHQNDKREFNRGALKNIGFLFIKEKYPQDYQNITLVFNDVDTMPLNKNFFHYETTQGIIKHFYGYKFALGGIVSINAKDFESLNGYPNLWAWGFEDNMLHQRALQKNNIQIDRSEFYPILDKNILQLKDGIERVVNRGEFDRYLGNTTEGIDSIHSLRYNIDESTGFVDVDQFETGVQVDPLKNKIHNLRDGNQPFQPIPIRKGRLPRMQMKFI